MSFTLHSHVPQTANEYTFSHLITEENTLLLKRDVMFPSIMTLCVSFLKKKITSKLINLTIISSNNR